MRKSSRQKADSSDEAAILEWPPLTDGAEGAKVSRWTSTANKKSCHVRGKLHEGFSETAGGALAINAMALRAIAAVSVRTKTRQRAKLQLQCWRRVVPYSSQWRGPARARQAHVSGEAARVGSYFCELYGAARLQH